MSNTTHITERVGARPYSASMIELLLAASLTLGLSESIETRLPEDPGMIYTVSFAYDGVKVGLDWKNRQVVPNRVCRKASLALKGDCQQAALEWLNEECAYYDGKAGLNRAQQDMQGAVCQGAKSLREYIAISRVADR
ncbi:MAG: hypothetical protein AAF513_19405 [Pseudomonadota bacterium]